MRIITVDNGNTNPHVGIFQNEKLESIIPLKDYVQQQNDYILISDVGGKISFKPSFDLKTKRIFKNGHYYFFDMPIHYSEGLGDDRLITAYSLFKQLKPSQTILLIDAGTFLTTDLISEKGFLGGYIFPGVNTFLNSYKTGSRLKAVKTDSNFNENDLPHSTEDAISGAVNFYLDSVIESVIKKTSPSKIILTGGSLELIKEIILKLNLPQVQLESALHLIHSSLYLIFQHHLQTKDL